MHNIIIFMILQRACIKFYVLHVHVLQCPHSYAIKFRQVYSNSLLSTMDQYKIDVTNKEKRTTKKIQLIMYKLVVGTNNKENTVNNV